MRKIFAILMVLTLLFSFANLAKCATPIWEKPKGIYGGEIDKVIISPNFQNDSTIFAGGPEGFYVSYDKGQTYSSVPLSVGYNLIFEGVTDFAISKDFATDKTVYIATKNGIYKTDNFGKTFSPYQTSIASAYITELVSDPITNTLLAVGVSFEKRADGKVLNTNLVMENDPTTGKWTTLAKFTSDYVTAITAYNNSFYVGTECGEVFKVDVSDKTEVFKSQSQITSISVNNNGIGFSTLGDGIFISSDFNTFKQELAGINITDLYMINTDNLYALEKTKELQIKQNGNYTSYNIPYYSTNISFVVTNNEIFIASYEYGVIKFDLGSKNFSLANTNITNVNTTCISFSPNYATNSTVYLGTANNGLYISKDGGETFTSFGSLDRYQILDVKEFTSGTTLVGTLGNGLFSCQNSSGTFDQIPILKNHLIGYILEYNNTLYLGTENDGLYIADLNFQNLKKVDAIPTYDQNINFIKAIGNYIFVATNGGNLYRSEDSGKTFKEIGQNKFWGMAITGFDISKSFLTDGLVLVGTAAGEFISTDRGNTFSPIYDLGTTWADGAAISPNYQSDGCMAIGAWGSSGTITGNIYLTKNKGLSYENIGSGTTNRYIIGVVLSPDFYFGKKGSIFALTSSGGLFKYTFKSQTEIILTVGKTEVSVNGTKKTIDAAPYIKDSRTLVPIRFISEAIGATVDWNDRTKEVTIRMLDKTVVLKINYPTAYVNGKQIPIDKDNQKVVPIIANGRTFVPVRFVSEALGATVEWNSKTKEIRITMGG